MKEIHQYGVVGFFNGDAKDGLCAAGACLILNDSHIYTFRLHCVSGLNMKAELLTLWCLCKVASIFGIFTLIVYGDSRVTIKCARGDFNLNVASLLLWCNKILEELKKSNLINFFNIFREHNQLAERSSELAMQGNEGILYWEEFLENSHTSSGSLYMFGF